MFDHFGRIPSISYPGVAQLVGRLVWDQDAASSSLATRTKAASFQDENWRFYHAIPLPFDNIAAFRAWRTDLFDNEDVQCRIENVYHHLQNGCIKMRRCSE